MSEQGDRNKDRVAARAPEDRYAYYRRCQEFRNNGEQCKAPAEKGSHICYAHAGQRAMALRREGERRAVLAEAVAEMRRKDRQKFEMANLLTDFKGIQVTLAVTARAVIDGRIDCKTAGRLLVQLQMASKLLRMVHREGHEETQISPQICAVERGRSKVGNLPEQTVEIPSTASTCSIVDFRAKGRSEQASNHEKALELRIKAAVKSTSNPESTKTARKITIRSPEPAVSGSCTFWQCAAKPTLLTA
ncbi:MAG: hypothetical protein ACJ71W_02845 [Terriglobales bacterium]